MLGVTLPYTDWNWPAPFDSIEWDVRIERESVADGYLWAHEVHFAGGATVLMALQSQGGYQADPPAGPVERTKIVQFWISGPPLEAELVDIPYPDARTFQTAQAGSDWWTINARYDWTVCRAYRLKVLPETSEPGVGVWYGGWIVDTETGTETQIGRMLVPAAWGRLTAPASSWTNRIGWTPLGTCADAEPVAAIFGVPLVDGVRPESVSPTNRFSAPPACPDTRFDDFPDAVRQEVGFYRVGAHSKRAPSFAAKTRPAAGTS